MPPELGRGGTRTASSQLYPLGAIAFEMLAGRPPFVGDAMNVMRRHVMDPPPELSDLAPTVPPPLAALVMALLEKEPERRPAGAEAVATELARIARSQQV
ncbi:MAG: hypothetical protein EPO40_12865 [Myxococcaceae bacterium]|nr:MAG: hypothetical protein EPO40_12865 [Myxococcaceae bacterium]